MCVPNRLRYSKSGFEEGMHYSPNNDIESKIKLGIGYLVLVATFSGLGAT